ncbi:serine/threonine-protein kinase pakD isoform X4 [Toxorhynchites rutilus septentrionalis]|uniref:serine/threonine-protein kinase pakD isoform X4 n=1 Tax=Toxorhynchites rutilus septentrionalis TaxID=329112 RepID=UPI00247B040E|nr:serine/threonine-protein kinase pakD isoform X4 [Toxorhynchites rutilus septentrionalis]
MTTATVAIQQSEILRRYPAIPTPWTSGSYARMNETQQMHTTDNSQQSNASANNLSIHNNNNTSSSGGGQKRTGGSSSNSDAKMDHPLQLLHRERERELHHQQQREQHQQSASQNQSQTQHHHNQHQQQQQQQQQHRPLSPTPSEQQYALKWNDFQSSILSSFRHLRDEEDFVDVTIACEQRSFTAHKVVLSACSPYFRKLLKANPCEHPIVILRDVRSEDIESLLRFMYNGEVHIGQDQLSDFLKTAQLLQVRGLADVTNPGRTSNNSSMLNSSSLSTPAVQELKASPTSTSLPWELPDDNQSVPPPQKRTKSSELYRKQHGLSPDDPIPVEHLPVGQHPLTRERDRNKDKSKDLRSFEARDRDRSLELRESLLGQALEGGPTLSIPSKHPDLMSLQAVASGEDSNSSDAASDHGDDIEGINGNVEHTRPSFPFLGLQGIPGLIPGPSGMHGENFDARQHCDTLIKEEAHGDDDDDEDDVDRQRQQQRHQLHRHHQQQQQQQQHHQQQQQQQQQQSCLSASIDDRTSGQRCAPPDGAKYEPEENDSRFMDDEEEEDEEGIDEEDMKDDVMSTTTMDSDYHKQLAAAGVLAAAAAAASGNGNPLGDGSEGNDFFAHKSGSRDLVLKQHILNEKARLQAHLQRHQQQLAGFLLSTTAAAAATSPTSSPQNCINQSTNTSASPFGSGNGSLNRSATNNNVNNSSINNNFSHDGKSQKQSQQQNERTNLFAYNNNSNTGQVYLLPCPLCEVPLEPRVFRQHLDRHYPRDSPVCPVIQCGRRFAHPNSVRNHMRLKHTSQWAKMKAMRSSGGPFTGIP